MSEIPGSGSGRFPINPHESLDLLELSTGTQAEGITPEGGGPEALAVDAKEAGVGAEQVTALPSSTTTIEVPVGDPSSYGSSAAERNSAPTGEEKDAKVTEVTEEVSTETQVFNTLMNTLSQMQKNDILQMLLYTNNVTDNMDIKQNNRHKELVGNNASSPLQQTNRSNTMTPVESGRTDEKHNRSIKNRRVTAKASRGRHQEQGTEGVETWFRQRQGSTNSRDVSKYGGQRHIEDLTGSRDDETKHDRFLSVLPRQPNMPHLESAQQINHRHYNKSSLENGTQPSVIREKDIANVTISSTDSEVTRIAQVLAAQENYMDWHSRKQSNSGMKERWEHQPPSNPHTARESVVVLKTIKKQEHYQSLNDGLEEPSSSDPGRESRKRRNKHRRNRLNTNLKQQHLSDIQLALDMTKINANMLQALTKQLRGQSTTTAKPIEPELSKLDRDTLQDHKKRDKESSDIPQLVSSSDSDSTSDSEESEDRKGKRRKKKRKKGRKKKRKKKKKFRAKSRNKKKKKHRKYSDSSDSSSTDDNSSSDSDRGIVPKGRESYIREVRKQRELSDVKKSDPVMWLISYLEFTKSPGRNWSSKQIRNCLPLIWSTEKTRATVQNWVSALPQKVREDSLKLEKAFLKKFARVQIRRFCDTVLDGMQPLEESNQEWFNGIWRFRQHLLRWKPKSVPSDRIFFEKLRQRFTCLHMISLLAKHDWESESDDSTTSNDDSDNRHRQSKSKSNAPTKAIIEKLCTRADRTVQEIDDRNRRLGKDSPAGDVIFRVRSSALDSTSDFETDSYFEIANNFSLEDAHNDESHQEYDGNLEEYYAEESLIAARAIVSVRAVARIITGRFPRKHFDEKDASEIKDWSNKMGGRHDDSCTIQVCPFYTCKHSGCNKSRGCSWKHIDRKNEWCPFGSKDARQCRFGAWCPKRHKGDLYVIWFKVRSTGKWRAYEWKDLRSPFSIHVTKNS